MDHQRPVWPYNGASQREGPGPQDRLSDTRAVQRGMPGGSRRAGLQVSGEPILNSRYQNDSYTPSFTSGPYDQPGWIEARRGGSGKVGPEALEGALEENCKAPPNIRKS